MAFGTITTGVAAQTYVADRTEVKGKKSAATVPFLNYTQRGAQAGTAIFNNLPEDFDWSMPQEPKAEGQKLDLTEGQ